MPTAEFENWWAEIQRQPGGLRDTDALDTARRIGRALREYVPADDFLIDGAQSACAQAAQKTQQAGRSNTIDVE